MAKTNYEAIKEMSMEEMAAVFYIFAKPFMDTFGFNEEQRLKTREDIRTMLTSETKFYNREVKNK